MSSHGRDDWLLHKQHDLKTLFEKLTYNYAKKKSSGVLLLKHLQPIFETIGLKLSDRQIREVMKILDRNGDGVVDEEDFWRTMLAGSTVALDDEENDAAIETIFNLLDKQTADGKIGFADFESVSTQMGPMFYAENRAEYKHILEAAYHALYGLSDKDPDLADFGIELPLFRKIATGKNVTSSQSATSSQSPTPQVMSPKNADMKTAK